MLPMMLACMMLLTGDVVRYEKITLRDGTIVAGSIVEEGQTHLLIRVTKLGGDFSYVQRLDKSVVAHREGVALPQSGGEPPDPPEVRAEAHGVIDKPAYLRTIFQEWEMRNLEVCGRRLLNLINHTAEVQLAELDRLTRRAYGVDFAGFAARAHFEYSLRRSQAGHFRLYFLTRLTRLQTRELLREHLSAAMAETVGCGPPAPSTHRCGRTDSIVRWLHRPWEYDGSGAHAMRFGRHVSRTLGMAREMARLNQALKTEREQLNRVRAWCGQLTRLLEIVQRRRNL